MRKRAFHLEKAARCQGMEPVPGESSCGPVSSRTEQYGKSDRECDWTVRWGLFLED